MIEYKGGDGSTREKSILILGAKSDLEGVEAEYKYLEMLYGEQNAEWQFSEQTLIMQNEKYYDVLEIEFRDQRQITFWFDITDFYGKEDE